MPQAIAGYDFGATEIARSPVTAEELETLKSSVLFGDEDEGALRTAGDVLEDQVEDVLEVWYGFVAAHPHLVHYFSDRENGSPIGDYLERVRARFGQWILDTCRRPYDQHWLDYQEEIALRHTREKKNQTDSVRSVDHIPLRYVICFIYPITATMRPFLEKGGHSAEEVEAMHQAWCKAVTMQVALWSRPYAEADW
jgi:Protoglobin